MKATKCTATALLLAILMSGQEAVAQQLPTPDGIYTSSSESCDDVKSGEADMYELQISNSGRTIGLPEVTCQIASIKQLRSNRYLIEADCLELGEHWVHTSMIDVTQAGIVKDGVPHDLCLAETVSLHDSSGDIDYLIEEWYEKNENCRGGSGNDPATGRACDERDTIGSELAELGYCYGKEGQTS